METHSSYQGQTSTNNGFAIVALVLGILGVVTNLIPFIPYLFGLLAIIFGIIGLRFHFGKGMAIAGIILGAITFGMKFLFWMWIFFFGFL